MCLECLWEFNFIIIYLLYSFTSNFTELRILKKRVNVKCHDLVLHNQDNTLVWIVTAICLVVSMHFSCNFTARGKRSILNIFIQKRRHQSFFCHFIEFLEKSSRMDNSSCCFICVWQAASNTDTTQELKTIRFVEYSQPRATVIRGALGFAR